MKRKLKRKSAGPSAARISHVVLKHRDAGAPIFSAGWECGDFLWYLGRVTRGCDLTIHAVCVVRDQIQIIAEPGAIPLFSVLSHLRQWSTPHLRFRSVALACDELLTAVRKIDLLPVHAGLVAHPVEYPYGSYIAYTLGYPIDGLTTDKILGLCRGENTQARRSAYAAFVGIDLHPAH